MGKGKPLKDIDEPVKKREQRILNLVQNRGKKVTAPVESMDYMLAMFKLLSGGYTNAEVCRKFQEQFPEMSDSQAEYWRKKSLKQIKKAFNDRADSFRSQQIHRLESVYQQALDRNDLKNALKAIDIMNKTVGFYRENEPQAAVQVTFQFGDSPQPQQIITVTPQTGIEEDSEEE